MDMEKAVQWGLFGTVAAGIVAGALCLVMCARSDGAVDYCRVIYNNDSSIHLPVYIVEGHRNWRPDIRVAIAQTAEEAEAKRKALCPR